MKSRTEPRCRTVAVSLSSLAWIAVVTLMLVGAVRCESRAMSDNAQAFRCLNDRMRRRVRLPENVGRVSCDDILCLESLATLGSLDAMVQSRRTDAPWTALASQMNVATRYREPNIESMLKDRVDVAFVYPNRRAFERYEHAGIAALVAQSTTREAVTGERFINDQKESLKLYAQVVGRGGLQRARAWADYADAQVAKITGRTATLSIEQRRSVYYVRGPSLLRTHGRRSCTFWYTRFAGGDLVTSRLGLDGRGDISAEQLIAWDPEVIFVGRQYGIESVLGDPRFRILRAVKRRQVYPVPSGIFYWDGGPESVLLMLWAAKRLHPKLFADLNLEQETRQYYRNFYGILLDDSTIDNMLLGNDSLGMRYPRVRE